MANNKDILPGMLSRVEITSDAFHVCLAQALTTEKEEVMGLLLGDTLKTKEGVVAKIISVSVLARSDKRKDRVEISPEQLAAASHEAEAISKELKLTTRVIGWYHSHPHITVYPSHVDVQTQANYQMLDEGFIGLIFSVFNTNSEQKGKIQVIAFQSIDHAKQYSMIAADIAKRAPEPPKLQLTEPAPSPQPSPKDKVTSSVLEPSMGVTSPQSLSLNQSGHISPRVTSPSASAPPASPGPNQGKENVSSSLQSGAFEELPLPVSLEKQPPYTLLIPAGAGSLDLSVVTSLYFDKSIPVVSSPQKSSPAATHSNPSQQSQQPRDNSYMLSQAKYSPSPLSAITSSQSAPAIKTTGYSQVDVPLHIVPTGAANTPNTISNIVKLQRIMLNEEKMAYTNSLTNINSTEQASNPVPSPRKQEVKGAGGMNVDTKQHLLVNIHSASIHQKALCRLLEIGCNPLLQLLADQQAVNTLRIAELEEKKKKLMAEEGPASSSHKSKHKKSRSRQE